ncbi:MAG: lipoyl synthase [Dehalococcoidales bacterium]|nr:lipoyl synthase [Dehalococcoidales bacterium]
MAGPAKPRWFRRNAPDPTALARMSTLLDGLQLHTVCQSAHCPNQGECFGRGVATFMILGDICTRNCTFCAVEHGRPAPPDADEPEHIVAAVKKLGLRHVVVTSVTRDDLADGGAQQFARVVTEARNYDPDISLEVLIPDFQGSLEALQLVTVSKPSVLNHNVETVPRLYPEVRPQADYQRSVQLLRNVKSLDGELITKSGLMLGLGEKREEVLQVMTDLRAVDCDFITIGQYLRPSMQHHPIVRFVPPEEFEEYKDIGVAMGFRGVASAPLVRSSFHADQMFARINQADDIDSE